MKMLKLANLIFFFWTWNLSSFRSIEMIINGNIFQLIWYWLLKIFFIARKIKNKIILINRFEI